MTREKAHEVADAISNILDKFDDKTDLDMSSPIDFVEVMVDGPDQEGEYYATLYNSIWSFSIMDLDAANNILLALHLICGEQARNPLSYS
jgi:hypothetical protein